MIQVLIDPRGRISHVSEILYRSTEWGVLVRDFRHIFEYVFDEILNTCFIPWLWLLQFRLRSQKCSPLVPVARAPPSGYICLLKDLGFFVDLVDPQRPDSHHASNFGQVCRRRCISVLIDKGEDVNTWSSKVVWTRVTTTLVKPRNLPNFTVGRVCGFGDVSANNLAEDLAGNGRQDYRRRRDKLEAVGSLQGCPLFVLVFPNF
ncbi:uncharacterized protein BKA78DRAFT_327188 [Phyllosticta capitalensis]|uniref:uncharacterized protein n=1 Tax=Phyllosticta capitalensis TaxID=121624 RepID=UPI0031322AF5